MTDPLEALYKAIAGRLRGGNPLWDDRVYPEFAPGPAERPLIVYSHVGGGEENRIRPRDPTYVIDIKCITSGENAPANAMSAAGFITELIDNQGSQDVDENGDPTDRAVSGDDEWAILTITQGVRIHVVDNWSTNGPPVYHSGHDFTIVMEAI